jgi:hypothetical protein
MAKTAENTRNGKSKKTFNGDLGELLIERPRIHLVSMTTSAH